MYEDSAKAQCGQELEGSVGTEFLILIMENIAPSSSIFITTKTSTTVNISTSENLQSNLKSSIDQETFVNSSANIVLPQGIQCSYFEKEPKAVLVHSQEPINVLISDNNNPLIEFRIDTTTVIPVEKLETSYIISSFNQDDSHFAIAAFDDDTNVTISLKISNNVNILISGRTYGDMDTFELSLDRLETFQIGALADFSGTRIDSNKRVAVFSGTVCLTGGDGFCSPALEQMPPISRLDDIFIVPPKFNAKVIRVLSPRNTTVQISKGNATKSQEIYQNVPYDIPIDEEECIVIESESSILATMIAFGSTPGPFIAIVPGINQYLTRYKVLVAEGYPISNVAIMIETEAKTDLLLNNQPIENYTIFYEKQVHVGCISYAIIIVEFKGGQLIVESEKTPFGLMVYGQNTYDGHGFAGNIISSLLC
ncbi:IgGFc-binding protein-like [Saccostrea echinata]|uniref:IgGFc-binding protein-like n=1 Tax=Saccostrea echinata TaxID=191078 RepID=UPI002A7F02AC|nr:IgGFc-binding protein-like [Saccostrea echinata]